MIGRPYGTSREPTFWVVINPTPFPSATSEILNRKIILLRDDKAIWHQYICILSTMSIYAKPGNSLQIQIFLHDLSPGSSVVPFPAVQENKGEQNN